MATASSVSTRSGNITWTFDTTYTVGRFVDGSPWVLVDSGTGYVRIIDLPHRTINTDVSGSQLDRYNIIPYTQTIAGGGSYATTQDDQGFSNRGAIAGVSYVQAFNDTRTINNVNPLDITPVYDTTEQGFGKISILVSSLDNSDASGDLDDAYEGSVVLEYGILTIVTIEPADTSFRPPIMVGDKPIYVEDAINMRRIPLLDNPVAGGITDTGTMDWAPLNDASLNLFNSPYIVLTQGLNRRALCPYRAWAGANVNRSVYPPLSLAMLHCCTTGYDYNDNHAILNGLIQMGIDADAEGGEVTTTGDMGGTRLESLVLKRRLFDESVHAHGSDFQTVGQSFYVDQPSIDGDYSDCVAGQWPSNQINMPEWQDDRLQTGATRRGSPLWLDHACAGLGDFYRNSGSAENWHASHLALMAMGVTPSFYHPGTNSEAGLYGGRVQGNAVFDYLDRYYTQGEINNTGGPAGTFIGDMWDLYRYDFGGARGFEWPTEWQPSDSGIAARTEFQIEGDGDTIGTGLISMGVGSSIQFYDNSTFGSTYTWDVDNNSGTWTNIPTETGQNPVFTFNNTGEWLIRLTTDNGEGPYTGETVFMEGELTSTIARHNITWTLSAPRFVGYFINGDPWVKPLNDAGVQANVIVSSVSPAPYSTSGGGNNRNCSMADPPSDKGSYQSYTSDAAGWRSASIVVFPKTLVANASKWQSLISSVSGTSNDGTSRFGDNPGSDIYLKDASILTVLPAGENVSVQYFRPRYVTNDVIDATPLSPVKTMYRKSQVGFRFLKKLAGATGTYFRSGIGSNIYQNYFEHTVRFWVQHGQDWHGRQIHPYDNQYKGYWEDLADVLGDSMVLAFVTDPTTINASEEDKINLVINLLQIGLDSYWNGELLGGDFAGTIYPASVSSPVAQGSYSTDSAHHVDLKLVTMFLFGITSFPSYIHRRPDKMFWYNDEITALQPHGSDVDAPDTSPPGKTGPPFTATITAGLPSPEAQVMIGDGSTYQAVDPTNLPARFDKNLDVYSWIGVPAESLSRPGYMVIWQQKAVRNPSNSINEHVNPREWPDLMDRGYVNDGQGLEDYRRSNVHVFVASLLSYTKIVGKNLARVKREKDQYIDYMYRWMEVEPAVHPANSQYAQTVTDVGNPFPPGQAGSEFARNMWQNFWETPPVPGAVGPTTTADFSASPLAGTAPLTVSFTDNSSGDVTEWGWNFGDRAIAGGGTSSVPSPIHTYSLEGTYDVSLTVTGSYGTDNRFRPAYIFVSPEPPRSWIDDGTDFKYRNKLTVNPTLLVPLEGQEDGSYPEFPALVIVKSTGISEVTDTGIFRFTEFQDSGQLPFELVDFKTDIGGGTGQIISWVNIPVLDPSSSIYCYYGPGVAPGGPPLDPTGVWDTGYQRVYHLDELVGGVTYDSSRQQVNATANNAPFLTGGIDLSGMWFTKANEDDLDAGAIGTNSWDAITVSAWAEHVGTADARIVAKTEGIQLSEIQFALLYDSAGDNIKVRIGTDGTDGSAASDLLTSTPLQAGYNHVGFSWSADNAEVRIYINGVRTNSYPKDGDTLINLGNNLAIANNEPGALPGSQRLFDGRIDEVRISNTVRADAWFETEYANQLNPFQFWTIGNQEYSSGVITPPSSSVAAKARRSSDDY